MKYRIASEEEIEEFIADTAKLTKLMADYQAKWKGVQESPDFQLTEVQKRKLLASMFTVEDVIEREQGE